MPQSVLNVFYCREVKNQATGLDLMVTSVKELPGIISYTLEYTVVVISNIRCFKLPQHKDTDTVQFTVSYCVLYEFPFKTLQPVVSGLFD